MRRVFVIIICILLFLMCNAYALEYDDIKLGMNYKEVKDALRGYELQESSKSITLKNNEYKVSVGFSDGVVNLLRFEKMGEKTSSIELFDSPWYTDLYEIIDTLEEEKAYYQYRPRETKNTTQNGKRIRLEQPVLNHIVHCYGFLDYIPVEYSLTFNQEEELTGISISPSDLKEEKDESNYFILLSYMVKKHGFPEEAKVDDHTSFSNEDGSASLYDSCYWDYQDTKYELTIETTYEKSLDDETISGDLYKYVSLNISQIYE